MSLPKGLIIEYENGSSKRVEFSKLSKQSRLEITKLGMSPAIAVGDHYALLVWKDGWKEVVEIPKKAVELLRYYTLERTEVVGRMAIIVGEDCPLLFLVKRLPKQLKGLLLMSHSAVKEYALEEKRAIREGGKIERIFYDKKDLKKIAENEGNVETWEIELIGSFKTELGKRGLSAEKLLSMGETLKAQTYREISEALGVWAMERQEDVYGFMQLMAENLLASKQ